MSTVPEAAAPGGIRVSELRATFEHRSGATRLQERYHTSPIKIAKSFPLGSGAGVLVMDVSPGMLEGDAYRMDWTAGSNTMVQLSNQSFLKVHPCPGGGGASLRQRFIIGEHAVMEHMPEPVMLFADAAFASDTEVMLAPGACWMQAEVLCPGRTLRGEVFRYRRLDSKLAVYEGGQLIYRQNQRIIPGEQLLGAPGSWQGMTHWGTFCVFSSLVDRRLEEKLREAMDSLQPVPGREVVSGVSLTWRSGLVVQAGARSAWTLQRALEHAWLTARKLLRPDLPDPLRKALN
ncbi:MULTISPECIES: urease accessory protein UreD [unclassified Paenibacillus]|uniref:urease accessory protein UreD n=1 Tax=unclassified Paenibacillus TaxID=185978 RepID=UPI0009559B2C|nr:MULTISPECIES: urease accessory protein UreD [unclassified Paenibacillus]ASS66262.1 urease accessory protein UreD [Paenibacillus sp. RUD330]SIQ09835.1 urease accessory protein [Paenibacillus sp. RU4X]SIQ30348.1 urease accessory protein [Paenibacillus sp. RU4T]